MANFFRGLASGLESGYKLGDTLQKYRERQAYEEAMKAQPEFIPPPNVSPEDLSRAQAETAALQQQDIREFGLSPQEAQRYAPASPGRYSFLGKEYTSPLSEAQIGLARREQMANVAAQYGNPLEAERLRASIRAEQADTERLGMERERLGLTRQTTEQQLKQGEQQLQQGALTLAESQRKTDDEKLLRSLNDRVTQFQQTNQRAPSISELRNMATELGATQAQLYTVGSTLTGIAETEAKASAMDIAKKIKGASLDKLIDLHKNDPTFDDNSYFEKIVGKDGKITLIQKDNAGKTIGSQSFSSANEATAYLAQQATDPANVFTWLQASRAKEAAIAKDLSAAAENQSIVGLRNQQAALLKDSKPTPEEAQELAKLQERFSKAKTPQEKAAVENEYNMYVAQMAAARGKPTPMRGKTERELTDREKTAYTEYLKAIKDLPPDTPQAALDSLASRYGVTEIVGSRGLPGWGSGAPAPAPAPASTSTQTPAPRASQNRGLYRDLKSGEIKAGQAKVDPRTFVLTKSPDTKVFVYVDPKTNKQYTEAEYQQLLR